MNTTDRRLKVALLVMAGIIIFNICIVVTGSAVDFYGYLS
jgi:hypothetical protein